MGKIPGIDHLAAIRGLLACGTIVYWVASSIKSGPILTYETGDEVFLGETCKDVLSPCPTSRGTGTPSIESKSKVKGVTSTLDSFSGCSPPLGDIR